MEENSPASDCIPNFILVLLNPNLACEQDKDKTLLLSESLGKHKSGPNLNNQQQLGILILWPVAPAKRRLRRAELIAPHV